MRTWLALAALLVAVAALGTWIYLKPTPETVETFALSGLKADAVTRVQLERGDAAAGTERSTGTPVAIERKEGVWRISTPFSARADPFQLERLLAILDTRASARFAADELARYGLDKPAARVTIDDQVFSYGAINTLTREQYVLTNNAVYPIPLSQRTTLPRDAEAMIARTLFAPGEIPVRFAMPGFTMTLTDGRWILDPDSAGVSADERNAWVDGWRNANALRAARARPGVPATRIGVTLKSGAEIAFGVLQREPELVLVRQDEAIEYAFVPEVGKRLIDPPVRKE